MDNSMKWICFATGMTVSLGLSYIISTSLSRKSHRNQYNIGKVETLKQQPPPPPPPQQQQQLTVYLVENCITIANKQIKYDEEKSINENTDVKRPVKHNIKKEEQKKRLNAQIRSLIYPKSPLLVFSELFKDIQIQLEQHQVDASKDVTSYTASIEVDGEIYSANHISKNLAKQKVCESFLLNMLKNKMTELSEKNEESLEMEVGENSTKSKPKEHYKEDFPWSNFASLAMNSLISRWEVKPVVSSDNYEQEESTVIKPQPKTGDIIEISEKTMRRLVCPKTPLMVFNELFKDIPIQLEQHQVDASHNVKSYTATLEVDGEIYSANHISKNQAKQKVCESFLLNMLKNKMNELSEKNEESLEMEVGENSTKSKPKGPYKEDFPWSNFASLAMNNLKSRWEVKPVVTSANHVQEESTVIKPQPKTGDIIEISENKMRRLVCPKTPLMVFNELFKDILIQLEQHQVDASHNVKSYTATLEVDGEIYSANHISKNQAKQKVCESFLLNMLKNKMNELSEKNEESLEMEVGENSTKSKPKGPYKEDFPWSNFASLAMNSLISRWEVKPVVPSDNYEQEESTVIKPQPKVVCKAYLQSLI